MKMKALFGGAGVALILTGCSSTGTQEPAATVTVTAGPKIEDDRPFLGDVIYDCGMSNYTSGLTYDDDFTSIVIDGQGEAE